MKTNERRVGEVLIVELRGELTLGQQNLQALVGELLERGETRILLDLENVRYMDSTSVGDLVVSYRGAAERDTELKLMKLPDRIRELLTMHHLIDVFEIFDDEESALASFSS